jgi:putative membrane protein
MTMSAFMAFLHHVAAFALVAGLAVELVLVKPPIDVERARKLQIVDMAIGLSAGIVLVVGMLRVVYFEKGAAYYFQNAAFLGKLSLFVLIALLSIYPTLRFMSWRSSIRRGEAPAVDATTLRTIRRVLHLELAGIVLLLLCAALMARGIGTFA